MDIVEGALPAYVLIFADIVFAVFMLYAIITAPWYKILDNQSSHVFLGTVLMIGFFWLIRSDVLNDINFHLLLTTTLFLMFEWQFALFAIVIIHVGLYSIDVMPIDVAPINIVFLGLVPICITRTLLKLSKKYLPHNFFIYIFINCFFAAGMSMLCIAAMTSGLYYLFANDEIFQQLENFLPFSMLMAMPEAAINGICMSGLIAYRPIWVATFHDSVYINGK